MGRTNGLSSVDREFIANVRSTRKTLFTYQLGLVQSVPVCTVVLVARLCVLLCLDPFIQET